MSPRPCFPVQLGPSAVPCRANAAGAMYETLRIVTICIAALGSDKEDLGSIRSRYTVTAQREVRAARARARGTRRTRKPRRSNGVLGAGPERGAGQAHRLRRR